MRVRSRRFLVEDVATVDAAAVEGSGARPDGAAPLRSAALAGVEPQTVVSLSCIDDDAQGFSLRVLWETELDAEVLPPNSWARVASRGFDSPRVFASYLNTLRWNLVTATNPRLFQAPYRAGIEVLAYQLEPLRKALALPRVNLFIADDVGLGKTIEAGLIVREMLLRQKVQRIVVSAPPSVVLQWRDELEQRFGLSSGSSTACASGSSPRARPAPCVTGSQSPRVSVARSSRA